MCARLCVVAAVVWVSFAVVIFQTRGGFPTGPRSFSRRLTPLDGRRGGGKQKRPRRCGHTRAMSTRTVVFACCACYTGARETLGVCARLCVVAAVLCVSFAVVLFFADGDYACSRSQTREGFTQGPRSSLRESLSTHPIRTLPSNTSVWQGGSRELALATLPGKHTDYGTPFFGVSGVPHTERV